jgi:DNA primase
MVATPLSWDEVMPELDPATFTIRTVPDRLERLKEGPWRGFFEAEQRIPDPRANRKAQRNRESSQGECRNPGDHGPFGALG